MRHEMRMFSYGYRQERAAACCTCGGWLRNAPASEMSRLVDLYSKHLADESPPDAPADALAGADRWRR